MSATRRAWGCMPPSIFAAQVSRSRAKAPAFFQRSRRAALQALLDRPGQAGGQSGAREPDVPGSCPFGSPRTAPVLTLRRPVERDAERQARGVRPRRPRSHDRPARAVGRTRRSCSGRSKGQLQARPVLAPDCRAAWPGDREVPGAPPAAALGKNRGPAPSRADLETCAAKMLGGMHPQARLVASWRTAAFADEKDALTRIDAASLLQDAGVDEPAGTDGRRTRSCFAGGAASLGARDGARPGRRASPPGWCGSRTARAGLAHELLEGRIPRSAARSPSPFACAPSFGFRGQGPPERSSASAASGREPDHRQVVEHLAFAGRSAAARSWRRARPRTLLGEGGPALVPRVVHLRVVEEAPELPERSAWSSTRTSRRGRRSRRTRAFSSRPGAPPTGAPRVAPTASRTARARRGDRRASPSSREGLLHRGDHGLACEDVPLDRVSLPLRPARPGVAPLAVKVTGRASRGDDADLAVSRGRRPRDEDGERLGGRGAPSSRSRPAAVGRVGEGLGRDAPTPAAPRETTVPTAEEPRGDRRRRARPCRVRARRSRRCDGSRGGGGGECGSGGKKSEQGAHWSGG